MIKPLELFNMSSTSKTEQKRKRAAGSTEATPERKKVEKDLEKAFDEVDWTE